MRLDDADIAQIEIEAHKLGPLAEGLLLVLIRQMREAEDAARRARADLVTAKDHAKDAGLLLERLRPYVEDEPREVDEILDDIAEQIDAVQEIGDV